MRLLFLIFALLAWAPLARTIAQHEACRFVLVNSREIGQRVARIASPHTPSPRARVETSETYSSPSTHRLFHRAHRGSRRFALRIGRRSDIGRGRGFSEGFEEYGRGNRAYCERASFGSAFGALFSGVLSSRFGRRRTLLVSAINFIIGALLCAVAPNEHVLIGARFILGIAVGIASFTAPLYLSEVAPQSVRGSGSRCIN